MPSAPETEALCAFYRRRTGYKISTPDFVSLLQGDLALARQFPMPETLRAVLDSALRLYKMAARMAAQSA